MFERGVWKANKDTMKFFDVARKTIAIVHNRIGSGKEDVIVYC